MEINSKTSVAIVGAGLIGRAWAITFARGGCSVRMWDPNGQACAQAKDFISLVLSDLEQANMLDGQPAPTILERIDVVSTMEEALSGAEWVQECGPEIIEEKRKIFQRLVGASAPDAVLASSTSALLPSAISEGLVGRERCLVAHPINPPYLVPAVEVVPAPWTEGWVVTRAGELMRAIGQAPIVMKKELDGFIMNRLQWALIEEAFWLVAEGYASADDVDRGIAEGIALRWSFMGPFETIDLNAPGGIADYVKRYYPSYQELRERPRQPADWGGDVLQTVLKERRERLPQDDLSKRQLWRDRRLMKLKAHKQQVDEELGR